MIVNMGKELCFTQTAHNIRDVGNMIKDKDLVNFCNRLMTNIP